MILTYPNVQVGDQRKIACYVTPSDAKPGLTLTSATFTAKLHSNGTLITGGSGAATVTLDTTGTLVSTALLTMPNAADTLVVNFALTWSDGVVDNTVSINVPVVALNT